MLRLVYDLFSIDRWNEVFLTIGRNKLRTALTTISVAWGIFVMVVLLGLGHGLDNGLRYSFRREASNGIWITANKTSVPYGGYDVGRKLVFENRDYDAAKKVPGVEHISGRFFVRGGQFGGGELKTQRGTKANSFDIEAVHESAFFIEGISMETGRFLDLVDVIARRKSAVIGAPVREFLFGDEDPIGKWIVIGGVPFQVVGVFTQEGSQEQERRIFIPVSTAQLAFHGDDRLGMFSMTVGDATGAQAKEISDTIVHQLAAAHNFDPDDPQAARVHNNVEGFERFKKLFWIISFFVVLIGLGTLAAGVVGVSNIMMIAVRERTREIGVRKAVGATPMSIIIMITQEAVFLTGVAGLLGLSAGVALLGALASGIQSEFIRDPSIDLTVGVLATLGLILAGALAGYFPARAAAKVNPIHALRDE